ncbi:hypothetical protein PHMEG_00010665 [Phytophthora megakarya]|uniref:DUF659 domain-containing protein n=1 Tax=Phytophthora megakarya TaxID=4795 RepID=A0A225WFL8_9STRA|nr:hypothetical protein PHMEG_00010665 [Phytophthora megakarya]
MLANAPVFREILALVAPTFKAPSRHKLSGELLKRVQTEKRLDVIKLVDEQVYVSLVTDGWSDTNDSSIINFLVVAPGMPSVFWSSWSTRSKQHTADSLASEVENVVEDIERSTSAQVVAIITDNAKTMRSATGQVHTRRPNIVNGGCSAHLWKDHLALLDEFKCFQQGVRDLGSKARNLVLPTPTCWYSVLTCLWTVLNNQDILEKLFLSPDYEEFRSRYRGTAARRRKLLFIRALIHDNVFWNNSGTIGNAVVQAATVGTQLRADPSDDEEEDPPDDNGASQENSANGTTESLSMNGEYENVADLPLRDVRSMFREKLLKRWKYDHTNAMKIDPTTNLDDFVGSDDHTVEDKNCKMAERCGVITSRHGTPKLTAEILAFKNSKRLGGETLRLKYSESSPQDYWNAMNNK